MSTLTIVMYHYVRDLERSRYPLIKGRTVDEFRRQLDYIEENHTVVRAEDVIAAAKGDAELPPDAAWLTFDDGYLDHFTNVFPQLVERGWQGSFFPPSTVIEDREVLDVNKVHFILASEPDTMKLVDDIEAFLENHSGNETLKSFQTYWRDLAAASRFDPAEIIFVKRMLQHALPEQFRNELADQLFEKYVRIDSKVFAAELYMSADQLRTMIEYGMHVGSHGARHYWLDRIDDAEQSADISKSLQFLDSLGAPTKDWIMCYPYGAYDERLMHLLKSQGCVLGLTTKVGAANLNTEAPLELSRLDTNDLPH